MDNRKEIREFLGTRRAKLTPEQTGLPSFGGTRRVPGLRRQEVACLYSEAYGPKTGTANLARFAFLNHRSHVLYPDWEKAADTAVAILHTEAGRDPFNKSLSELIGQLSTLTAYSADPGTPSEDGLRLLASWAATELVSTTSKENA
jgi:hypothetical protein